MNKDFIVKGLIFVAGAGLGSVVTWNLVKTKYEQIANEEIESMREYYHEKTRKELSEQKEPVEHEVEPQDDLKEEKVSYRKIANESGYGGESEEEEEDMDKPYVIPPEESWEQDYPTITLTYYEGDGVLADERDRVISNIAELVGEDFASHFGEYEDDSVYVRNDKNKVYYEILRDYDSYEDTH